jgi:tetratricopeptide (TPR) repeat protein
MGDLEGGAALWSRWEYMIIQPYAMMKYVLLLFLPAKQSFEHLIQPISGIYDLRMIIPIFFVLLIVFAVIKLYRKRDKIPLFAVGFYFIAFLPTSSVFPTISPVVENRIYLPGIGFYLLFGYLLLRFLQSKYFKQASYLFTYAIYFILACYIVFLGYSSYLRNELYSNQIRLWQDVVWKYPSHARAHNNLGILFHTQGKYNDAVWHYMAAVKSDRNCGEAYNNIGNFYLYNCKKYETAAEYYKKSIEVSPNSFYGYHNLGNLYKELKKGDLAIQFYSKALQINPNFCEAYIGLGSVYVSMLQYDMALKAFKRSIELEPGKAETYDSIGAIYGINKDYRMASQYFSKALSIDPNYSPAIENLKKLNK